MGVLHSREELFAREPVPIGRNDGSGGVHGTQKLDAFGDLLFACRARMAQDYAMRLGDLVVKEFAEVFHIHFTLVYVGDGRKSAELYAVLKNACRRTNDVGKLADARGLNDYSVGVIGVYRLSECLREVADKAAADAAGVHFGDIDSRILQKTAVDAYLTEFVLDEHKLLATVCLRNHFFDESRLARSQKARIYVNFHFFSPFREKSLPYILPQRSVNVNKNEKKYCN